MLQHGCRRAAFAVLNTIERRKQDMRRFYYRAIRKLADIIGGDRYTARFIDNLIQTALYLAVAMAAIAFFVWGV